MSDFPQALLDNLIYINHCYFILILVYAFESKPQLIRKKSLSRSGRCKTVAFPTILILCKKHDLPNIGTILQSNLQTAVVIIPVKINKIDLFVNDLF